MKSKLSRPKTEILFLNKINHLKVKYLNSFKMNNLSEINKNPKIHHSILDSPKPPLLKDMMKHSFHQKSIPKKIKLLIT
jgi:hypothetical protein